MTPAAVVFDLDDTLYLERDYVQSGFRAVGDWFRTEFGEPDFAERADAAFAAGRRADMFNVVLASYGLASRPMLAGRLVEVYRDHDPCIALCDDARDCLHALSGSRPLAIITDGSTSRQWNKIRALGVERLFNTIVVTGELGAGHRKPDPLAFQLVEERLGLRGEQLMYIGDNPHKDFQAPRALGWQTLQVRRKLGIYVDVPSSDAADHLVEDLYASRSILGIKAPAQPKPANLFDPRR
jgi:putative hydrolase of the HAD superfamily